MALTAGHAITPVAESAYIVGPRNAGRRANLRNALDYPVEAVCLECGGRIVCDRMLIGPEAEWRHEERPS